MKDNLPKKQKKLSEYILENYQSVGLMTLHTLSEQADVGVSTVMRTIDAFGYESFSDFRKDILNESFPVDSKWTLKKTLEDTNKVEDSSVIAGVWEGTIEILENSLTPDLIHNFTTATEMIIQSSRLNILGSRPYKAMALYLEQLLGEFYSDINQLSHDTEIVFDKILQFKQDEVMLVFAFDPYSERIIKAAKLANELGVKIILITDYISCPILPYASVTLEVKTSKEQFSVAPIITLIESLVIEIGKQSPDQPIQKLTKLEKTLLDNEVTFSHNQTE